MMIEVPAACTCGSNVRVKTWLVTQCFQFKASPSMGEEAAPQH
jgi:hypothetical protein